MPMETKFQQHFAWEPPNMNHFPTLKTFKPLFVLECLFTFNLDFMVILFSFPFSLILDASTKAGCWLFEMWCIVLKKNKNWLFVLNRILLPFFIMLHTVPMAKILSANFCNGTQKMQTDLTDYNILLICIFCCMWCVFGIAVSLPCHCVIRLICGPKLLSVWTPNTVATCYCSVRTSHCNVHKVIQWNWLLRSLHEQFKHSISNMKWNGADLPQVNCLSMSACVSFCLCVVSRLATHQTRVCRILLSKKIDSWINQDWMEWQRVFAALFSFFAAQA